MADREYFTLIIRENGKVIHERTLPDPFVHTTLQLGRTRLERLRAAWQTLRGKTFTLHVDGELAAVGDVMRLIHTWETEPPTREGPSVTMAATGGEH